jgi:hypothetical protein
MKFRTPAMAALAANSEPALESRTERAPRGDHQPPAVAQRRLSGPEHVARIVERVLWKLIVARETSRVRER